MKNNSIKFRLTVMSFLEFAVWGAYLVSMSQFLGHYGLGTDIFWFYTVQGLVSIFMPTLMGIVADRWIPAQKTLSLCHLLAGVFMIAAGVSAASSIAATEQISFMPTFLYYTLSVAFFMPTIGLSNSVAFNGLEKNGLSTVNDFPIIRTFGTVGFIATMWVVNFLPVGDGLTAQMSYWQWYISGGLSIVLAIYALTLPACELRKDAPASWSEALGFQSFKLFANRKMAIFMIFSMLLGVSLQITNSYGADYIHFFQKVPTMTDTFFGMTVAENATFLISLSQCAEALCILLIPFCLRKFGIKGVMLIAMFAWVLRFGFFGMGDANFPGVLLLLLSCIVYGVAFDFFNVSGGIYVDSQTSAEQRSSAQGLFMLMTNGIGASLGTFIAGKFIVNRLVDRTAPVMEQLEGWKESWYIFAAYALVVAVLFMFIFKDDNKKPEMNQIKKDVKEALEEPFGE